MRIGESDDQCDPCYRGKATSHMGELEYIKALGRFSAEEEKKQLQLQNETPKHHDHFVATMVRGVYASWRLIGTHRRSHHGSGSD